MKNADDRSLPITSAPSRLMSTRVTECVGTRVRAGGSTELPLPLPLPLPCLLLLPPLPLLLLLLLPW